MTSYGADWSVLQLESDPVPGDPNQAQNAARAMQQEMQTWSQHSQDLHAANDYGQSMPMDGDFAEPYRTHLASHPSAAETLKNSHEQAATALSQYAGQLEEAKTESQLALQMGTQAKENYDQAMSVYNQCVEEINSFPKVVATPQEAEMINAQIAQLQQQAMTAERYAQQAEQEWMGARQRAVQAGQLASEAESAAAQAVQSASPTSTSNGGGGNAVPAAAGGGAAIAGLAGASLGGKFPAGGQAWRPGDEVPPPLTGDRLPTKDLDSRFVGENDANNPNRFFNPSTVKYLNDDEREATRVFADNDGRLRWAKDGSLFDTSQAKSLWSGQGKAIFTMDRSGNLYASLTQRRGQFHHSSFLGGDPVVGAGELEARDGRLMLMTNNSGHYQPSVEMNQRVIETLRQRGVIFDPSFTSVDLG